MRLAGNRISRTAKTCVFGQYRSESFPPSIKSVDLLLMPTVTAHRLNVLMKRGYDGITKEQATI